MFNRVITKWSDQLKHDYWLVSHCNILVLNNQIYFSCISRRENVATAQRTLRCFLWCFIILQGYLYKISSLKLHIALVLMFGSDYFQGRVRSILLIWVRVIQNLNQPSKCLRCSTRLLLVPTRNVHVVKGQEEE